MSRIERLTEKQAAQLSVYRDKWLARGLQTGLCDRPAMERAADEAYRCAEKKPPRLKIWLGSPFSGAIGAAILTSAQVGDQVGAQVWDQVGAQVRAQVWDQVRAQVGAQVRAQVWDQVRAQVGDQVWDQVRAQVWAQVRAQVWAQVGAQVGDQVWDQVGDQVWDQVGDQVWAQVYQCGYGLHDANWLAFYEFFGEVCGLEICGKLAGLNLLSECGWWWPFENAVILTERPISLLRDERFRLHNPSGPAIAYPDGFEVHVWHGTRIPAFIVEHPEQITVAVIEDEKNAEVRRAMMEKYGYERYMSDCGANVVEEFPVDYPAVGLRTARLLFKPIRDDEPICYVDMLNSTPELDGSTKRYMIRVDPNAYDGKASKSLLAGMASTWRSHDGSLLFKRPQDYQPHLET